MIKQINGNIFDYTTKEDDYIVHCISADFCLGAGIAKTIDEKYAIRDKLLSNASYCKPFIKGNGYVIVTGKVFNLVTKGKYYEKPTYGSLEASLLKLRELCKSRNINTIHMPRIGCGLDKLRWNIVFDMICRIFINSGIDVNIYYL